MLRFRSAIAFPVYALAMVFHLLTVIFTVLAQKTAGEDYEQQRSAVEIDTTQYARSSVA